MLKPTSKSCLLPKPVEKKPFFIVKLIQTIYPIPVRAFVRYDGNIGKWAVIDPVTNDPKQHFECALLENVTFSSAMKKVRGVGCGPSREEHIGIAEGDLSLHRKPPTVLNARNLSFRDGQFLDQNGDPITNAKRIALMPDRRAIYWA